MSAACETFRAELERALEAGGRGLARLAVEPHARACADCRAELARERALERLLERVPPPAVPPGLARRVLLAVNAREASPALDERELDELLDAVPSPAVPPDLGPRVLAGLAPARAPRTRRRPWVWLAAAGIAVAAAVWIARPRPVAPPVSPVPEVVDTAEDLEADDQLLAYAFERWEELHDEDLDLWLASLDPLDELTLEYNAVDLPAEELPQAQNAGGGGGF